MFVMINRMTVPEKWRGHFEEVFKTRKKAVDRRPGFIKAEILKPVEGEAYLVVTHWEKKEDFDAWVGSPEYREGHQRIKDFVENGRSVLTSSVEIFEVLAT